MWLIKSSIGRKVVMSVTGIALVLFLTFHASMNIVALISAKGYNMICEFLGANWYAVAATVGLAALVALHFIFAFILTLQNRRARGNSRYAVTDKPGKVEWASQNMLVLGIIVVLGMVLHLYNFWYNMMFAELAHIEELEANAANGVYHIVNTFSCPVFTAIYIVWLAALLFHLTHGIWSAMQTLGFSGKVWFQRWKCIGNAWAVIVVAMFAVVAIAFWAGYRPCDYEEAMNTEAAACPMKGECKKACDKSCAGPCEKPCMKACEKACEKPCHEAGEGHCEKPCHKACAEEGEAVVEHNHLTKDIKEDCPACPKN